MNKVGVLMSTYNGERYIREQLDSIFVQQDVEVVLFIRDDGSTDDTKAIIKEYSDNYSVVQMEDNENLGPGRSFMKLIYEYYNEPVDYFAFADQDDIWLDDKLITAIRQIEQSAYEGPVLYSSNQFLYVDGENKGNRYNESQSIALIPHMTKNTIAGCTFVFNKELARIVAESPHAEDRIVKYRLHDAWLMLVAIVCGYVIYDETSHMLYRIHNDNTVGVKEISLKKRIGRLKRFCTKRDDANIRMVSAKQLLQSFDNIKENDKEILKLYANYQDSWKDKKNFIRNDLIISGCLENPMVFKLKTLLNFI